MHTFSKKLFVNIICNPSTKHTEHSAIRHFFPQCNCASASLQNGTRGFPWHSIRLSEITSPDAWSHKKEIYISFQKIKPKKKDVYFVPTEAVKEIPTGNRFLQQCSYRNEPKYQCVLPHSCLWVEVQTGLVHLTHLLRAPPSTALT